jgi:glucose/arabinose dehydrogenase
MCFRLSIATRSSSRATAPGIEPRRSAGIAAKLSEDGAVKSIEPFITGFIENNNYVGRPAYVEFVKDGSMLMSDDFNGAVYRVTYSSTVAR